MYNPASLSASLSVISSIGVVNMSTVYPLLYSFVPSRRIFCVTNQAHRRASVLLAKYIPFASAHRSSMSLKSYGTLPPRRPRSNTPAYELPSSCPLLSLTFTSNEARVLPLATCPASSCRLIISDFSCSSSLLRISPICCTISLEFVFAFYHLV